jgi:hypothetical protein
MQPPSNREYNPVSGGSENFKIPKEPLMTADTRKRISRAIRIALTSVGIGLAIIGGGYGVVSCAATVNAQAQAQMEADAKAHWERQTELARIYYDYCAPVSGEAFCKLDVYQRYNVRF